MSVFPILVSFVLCEIWSYQFLSIALFHNLFNYFAKQVARQKMIVQEIIGRQKPSFLLFM